MPDLKNKDRERALIAAGEELAGLVHHPSAEVLLALLENPALDETQVCLLLERKDLPGEILEEIARRKALLKSYRVKRALAFHPRTPRLVSLRLLRDLYLMDLVQVAILPGVSAELKRNAEEQLIARLPQLPLGQKITLARRGAAGDDSFLPAATHRLRSARIGLARHRSGKPAQVPAGGSTAPHAHRGEGGKRGLAPG